MLYLVLLLLAVVSIELFVRLRILETVQTFSLQYRKIIRVFLSDNISDHWKEKVLLRYASQLFGSSIKLLLLLGTIAVVAVLMIGAPGYMFSDFTDLPEQVTSVSGLIWVTGFAVGYAFLRSRLNADTKL